MDLRGEAGLATMVELESEDDSEVEKGLRDPEDPQLFEK